MSDEVLLGVDEGTTAVKVAAFDLELRPVASARRELASAHPAPERVEQDPEAILAAVEEAVAEVLDGVGERTVLAAGLAHQGESVLAWEHPSGAPLTPVVVWQDKRQEELLARLDPGVAERSGLPLDPYFSAGKLAWLLENDRGVQAAARGGTLRLGTVDAFLADRLAGRFATDLSTASRTQLLALGGTDWDAQLLRTFGVERAWLPSLGPTFGPLARLRSPRWDRELALCAQLVDQQAALAGAGAVRPGQVKATYGTGVFVLGRTAAAQAAPGLLPTVAWAPSTGDGGTGPIEHALDGGVFTAGALLDWLSQGLGLARDARELLAAARYAGESAGVRVLPALAGLGAPWWRPDAHGVIAGLHGGVEPGHVARAAVEAIAWRVADIVEAMARVMPVERLLVDGGLSNDDTLVQIQADALGIPLEVRPADATTLGAALLAGVGAGCFASVEAAADGLPEGRVVTPELGRAERHAERERWRAFLNASAAL